MSWRVSCVCVRARNKARIPKYVCDLSLRSSPCIFNKLSCIIHAHIFCGQQAKRWCQITKNVDARRFACEPAREKEENNVIQVKRRWKREIIIEGLRASSGRLIIMHCSITSFTLHVCNMCALYYRMELIAISWFARFEALFCPSTPGGCLILHTMMPAEQWNYHILSALLCVLHELSV